MAKISCMSFPSLIYLSEYFTFAMAGRFLCFVKTDRKAEGMWVKHKTYMLAHAVEGRQLAVAER